MYLIKSKTASSECKKKKTKSKKTFTYTFWLSWWYWWALFTFAPFVQLVKSKVEEILSFHSAEADLHPRRTSRSLCCCSSLSPCTSLWALSINCKGRGFGAFLYFYLLISPFLFVCPCPFPLCPFRGGELVDMCRSCCHCSTAAKEV